MLATSVDLYYLNVLRSKGKFDIVRWRSGLSSIILHHEEMLLALYLYYLSLCHQHPLLQLFTIPHLFGHISPYLFILSLLGGLLDEFGYTRS